MVKKVTFALGALALALGGAALVAPAAHADSIVSVSGARAAFLSDGRVGEAFRLTDTACDNFRVYLSYRLGSDSEVRHYFSGGCNRSIEYHKRWAEGARVSYRACVDIPGADRCSVWRVDTA